MQVQLLNGVSAANNAPSAATAGVPLARDSRAMQFVNPQLDGFYDNVDEVELVLKASGTTPAISYLRLWGYFQVSKGAAGTNAPQGTDASFWAPLGTGTDADKGKLNGGAALGVVTGSEIRHAERVRGLREPTRIYLEVGTVTGTGVSIDAWLVARGQSQP